MMAYRFKKKLVVLAYVLGIVCPIAARSSNIILGKWKPIDHSEKQVEIHLGIDALYYGKAINPNENELLSKLQHNETTHTFKGIMVAPDKETEVNVTINIVHNETLKIVAKKFAITKNIQFARIK